MAISTHRRQLHIARQGLTLVEMLVGMAITLVMMAAVVNLFANISEGVRNRRATMEVSAALRIARAQLYKDLAGATCLKYPKDPFSVMPKPDVNNPPDGYFEYVEGERSDEYPSLLFDGITANGEIDPALSLVPSSNRLFNEKGEPIITSQYTDGGGLGDYDDILAMTVESQAEPFRGKGRGLRAGGDPSNPNDWVNMSLQSRQAEVIWFAVENPVDRSEGEPGMRRIYRRVLLIAPWYGTETRNYGGPALTGLDPLLNLTALPPAGQGLTTYPQFLAALRAFQMEYDISVRLETRPGGETFIVPNTLADLARRENRFEHLPNNTTPGAYTLVPANTYPHVFVSRGSGYPGATVQVIRHYLDNSSLDNAQINAVTTPVNLPNQIGEVTQYNVIDGGEYTIIPTILVTGTTGVMATARPIMREIDEGIYEIARVVHGPVPFTMNRVGEDLVLDNVLAFDAKVFDPGAPLFNYQGSVINPGSFSQAFLSAVNALASNPAGPTQIAGFGAYADLGWNNLGQYNYSALPAVYAGSPIPLFQQARRVGWHPRLQNSVSMEPFYRFPYSTYDTWTTYYETDGIDQDGIHGADQGTNGLDDIDPATSGDPAVLEASDFAFNGPDDPMESETSPPYPYALKGVQAKIRIYEPESRQIRETTVTRNLAK